MVIVSPLVTDGVKVGEIFAVDGTGYTNDESEVYVVFQDGSADWKPVTDLQLVGQTANTEVPAA